ncbi:MAG: hypothetical protein A2V96_01405 [Candidatus Yonathbacteria bacterium RBG_16_43_6]|uniref:DJ-1/PfpI domain-containing protein n=2 Tax=Parcubacteria group TaxID=1794811 RepID=A0A1G2SB71_9BACT|nr:MAG: ThiJ/PfpI domain protein [Candidatus Azambacteria bacterium GW2011_GWA1_44_9]OHA78555.1 MAG: hypothetical protein A2658_02085 [Candidatus Yonathbacteria bacterium RIFCSPHIGHO2_01_FULL_44_19]OHA80195.1 MAG: hypothetical protein A2V96_01405 [Candidatus Yonathbacteria bacterium RBG_16_43_6]OHA82293.1 MAG: hypothetical protein A3B07_02030 [Candidatus Yonathbacteria bacterium RIFCSPLOWO2_01_FULL_43_27]
MQNKVLLIIAQKGFQSKEYFDTKDVLQNEGIHVVTTAPLHEMAYSHMGDEVMPDLALSDVRVTDYDGVFAIGGPGALEYLDTTETARIFMEAHQTENYPYGAICIAPRILAKAGVLKNVHATGWDGDGELQRVFDTYGVIRVEESVVMDGVVVTAHGPAAARDFGKKIIEVLRKK